VSALVGADPERAVYYPKDRDYLRTLEPNVVHYEVLVAPGPSKGPFPP
jgi:hypothetical protein